MAVVDVIVRASAVHRAMGVAAVDGHGIDAWGHVDGRFYDGRLGDRDDGRSAHLAAQWGLLHRRNDIFADALLVQRNDVRDDRLSLHTTGGDLIQDHAFPDSTAAHCDHVTVADRTGLDGLSVNGGGDPLLGLVLLRVVLVLISVVFIAGIAQQSSGDDADGTTDGRAGPRLVVIFTDNRTCDCSGDAAQGGSALSVVLGLCRRCGAARDQNRQRGQAAADPMAVIRCEPIQEGGSHFRGHQSRG